MAFKTWPGRAALLFHHSRRVYLFGMLQARGRRIVADPELVYVGAMCHDLGLTDVRRPPSAP